MNVIEIEERIDEILAQGFKPADFLFDFIEAYGAPKSVIKQLRVGQQDVPPRVYRRAKLSENCPLWNMHKRRRPRSRIHPSSVNARYGFCWNTAMSIKAKLRR